MLCLVFVNGNDSSITCSIHPQQQVAPPVAPPTTPDASGNAVFKGMFVQNEWLAYGMTLFAEGGIGSLPRIFDSSDPGGEDTCGDADLGTPNKACPGGGPGHGIGGEPGAPGENCIFLGNILIIQEPGSSCPDDHVDGGVITLG